MYMARCVRLQAVETCSRNFPIRNYTVLVDGNLGPTMLATPAVAMVNATLTSPFIASDGMFQIGVKACSDVTCRNSTVTVPLSE